MTAQEASSLDEWFREVIGVLADAMVPVRGRCRAGMGVRCRVPGTSPRLGSARGVTGGGCGGGSRAGLRNTSS